jgi:hypothetical protein
MNGERMRVPLTAAASVRSEPFRDFLAALVFDTGRVERTPGLPERERIDLRRRWQRVAYDQDCGVKR